MKIYPDPHEYHVFIENTTKGENTFIGPFCIIGAWGENLFGFGEITGRVWIGDRTVITGLASIDASTLDQPTKLGADCFMMKHAHIGHDAEVKDHCILAVGCIIGGHCVIHNYCHIGLNAVINPRIVIPPFVRIGAGSVVTVSRAKQMLPFEIWAGNPAKKLGPNTKLIEQLKFTDFEVQKIIESWIDDTYSDNYSNVREA